MMIAVHTAKRGKRLAGVTRYVQPKAERVYRLVVLRIDANLSEDPPIRAGGSRHECIRVRHLAPGRALVVGAINLCGSDASLENRALVRVAFAGARRGS